MHATDIATGAPLWVYALLVVLVVLGVRRLRPRVMPLPVALLPTAAFLLWSLLGIVGVAERVGAPVAAGAWLAGAALGAASAWALPEPRGERLPGNRVRLPASWQPLALYLIVFVARYACGAWAAIVPAQSALAVTLGMAVGAAATARLLLGVLHWRGATAA